MRSIVLFVFPLFLLAGGVKQLAQQQNQHTIFFSSQGFILEGGDSAPAESVLGFLLHTPVPAL